LINSGFKQKTEGDLFQESIDVIKDLIESSPAEALNLYNHAYQTFTLRLNGVTGQKEQLDL
jgi:hypothetical protein